jgi:hypothetical protein
MTQDQSHNLLHSLLAPLRKSRKNHGQNADEAEVLESKRRLEERIELALADMVQTATADQA